MHTIYSFAAETIDGKKICLAEFAGKLLLIVNVASNCGFTKQYADLEKLYRQYKDSGLVILGFPCNQFRAQEPDNAQTIKSFCEKNYQITFPLFTKIEVNGANTHPLYQFLKRTRKGIFGTQAIKWNFTKFLVDNSGEAVKRYSPLTSISVIENDIKHYLNSGSP